MDIRVGAPMKSLQPSPQSKFRTLSSTPSPLAVTLNPYLTLFPAPDNNLPAISTDLPITVECVSTSLLFITI